VWNQYQQEKRDETTDDMMLKPNKKQRKCLKCTEEVANLIEQVFLIMMVTLLIKKFSKILKVQDFRSPCQQFFNFAK
jgi:hypothetical protein